MLMLREYREERLNEANNYRLLRRTDRKRVYECISVTVLVSVIVNYLYMKKIIMGNIAYTVLSATAAKMCSM